ncbi:MAG: hypothetical protein AAB926_00970 [Patescibacteria group bacterium]
MLSKFTKYKKGFTRTPTLALRLPAHQRFWCAGLRAKPQLMPKLVRGFTFLETIVAIGILTIALASPLMLASSSIRAAGTARDKFIASYLASEAVEYLKNARDGNVIAGETNWLETIIDKCKIDGSNEGCMVDVTGSGIGASLLKCPQQCGSPIIKIKYEESSGLYQYQSGIDTKFTRIVEVEELVAGQEAKIIVTVSWDSYDLIIQDNIFNWR